jgi:predicted  nucleic acid-binding Zn-ribbon protein
MSDETCCGACGYPIHATKDKACDWCRQTADRIDALTAENERLERVVKDISDEANLAEQEACMVEDDFVKTEKEIEALTAKLAKAVEALRAVEQHEASIFLGLDAENNRRARWRGVMRKIKAALAETEGKDAP